MPPRTVPIVLDRARNLRFNINAIGDADHYLRATMTEVLRQAFEGYGMRVSDTRVLLWAGLKHEDRHLTIERAGELIEQAIDNGMTMAELQLKIGEAIAASGLFGGGEKKKVAESETASALPSGSPTPSGTPTAH